MRWTLLLLVLASPAWAQQAVPYAPRQADPIPFTPRGEMPRPGDSPIDPTANVKELVALSIKRLDDLRIAESRRLEELQVAENRRITGEMALRAEFAEKLANAEAKRIDAIRAVDVSAVAIATERATQQANVLAAQVTQSAETLRSLVASSAATLAAQQDQVSKQNNERISKLEQSQYTNLGQNQPQLSAQLAERLVTLEKMQNLDTGKGAGLDALWGYIIGFIGVAVGLYSLLRHRQGAKP
jgi:murein DD-endopeptidase MepM/ murein hydrolase activator NlpD